MYCGQCGAECAAGQKFCVKCGKPVAEGAAAASPAAASAPAAPSPPAQGPAQPASSNPYAPPHAATSFDGADGPARIHAGFWRRFAAFVIDIVGFYVAIFLVALGMRASLGAGQPMAEALLMLVAGIAMFLYFPLMESSGAQGTLGKQLLGIRVTNVEGGRIGFWHSVGRNVCRLLSSLPLYIGYMAAGFTKHKQAFHDMIAGTLVVKRGVPEQRIAAETGQKAGGNGAMIAIVVTVALFGFVAFMGILAAIAIPAYQDYIVRAQVVEALVVADDFKGKVGEALLQGTDAAGIDSANTPGLAPKSGRYYSDMSVKFGVVVVQFGNGANQVIAGKTLVLYPVKDDRGAIDWICGHHPLPEDATPYLGSDDTARLADITDVADKYLPLACRAR